MQSLKLANDKLRYRIHILKEATATELSQAERCEGVFIGNKNDNNDSIFTILVQAVRLQQQIQQQLQQ